MAFFRKDPALEAGTALYAAAVAQARTEPLYAEFAVPDTVEGRFEMVTLHVYLILRRLKGGADARKVGQKLFDVMFDDMDRSLRELGVGDLSVARKIRTLAEHFYGRVGAYEDALQDGARPDDLAAALGRNVYGDEDDEHAPMLAEYVRTAAAYIAGQSPDQLIAGLVRFSAVET